MELNKEMSKTEAQEGVLATASSLEDEEQKLEEKEKMFRITRTGRRVKCRNHFKYSLLFYFANIDLHRVGGYFKPCMQPDTGAVMLMFFVMKKFVEIINI